MSRKIKPTRRTLVKALGLSGAAAPLFGLKSGNSILSSTAEASGNNNVLIVVFLRGGADGMSWVVPNGARPSARAVYEGLRKDTLLRPQDAWVLKSASDTNTGFSAHNALSPLRALYDANELSFILGSGAEERNTSHFQQQSMVERGKISSQPLPKDGYLGRAYDRLKSGTESPLGRVSYLNRIAALSLLAGNSQGLAVSDFAGFTSLNSPFYRPDPNFGMPERVELYYGCSNENSAWCQAGNDTESAVEDIQSLRGIASERSFDGKMRSLATAIKQSPKLKFVTIDLQGWDTHRFQGNAEVNGPANAPYTGTFASRTHNLAKGLRAFADEAKQEGIWGRCNIVVMSEFGRTARENGASKGTDHGYGTVTMVLGRGPFARIENPSGYFPENQSDPFYAFMNRFNMLPVADSHTHPKIFARLFKSRLNASVADIDHIFPGLS